MGKGEQLAKLVAKGMAGKVGPFGGEDPYLDDNILTISSQGPDSIYRFNDDGSVDDISFEELSDEEIIDFLIEMGYDEDEIDDEMIEDARFHHYDTVKDLLDDEEHGMWFYFFEEDHPKLYKIICDLLK